MENGCQLHKTMWKVKSRNITITWLAAVFGNVSGCPLSCCKDSTSSEAGVWKTTEGILMYGNPKKTKLVIDTSCHTKQMIRIGAICINP